MKSCLRYLALSEVVEIAKDYPKMLSLTFDLYLCLHLLHYLDDRIQNRQSGSAKTTLPVNLFILFIILSLSLSLSLSL